MSAVTSYSRTAANNNSAAPNGWPEGQAASTVNDCAREMMKGIVDEATNNACKVVASVAGTNTITGSMTPDITAYSAGMIVVLTPANTNTGATTLNIDSLGALDVFNIDGTACVGGELVVGIPAVLVLDSGADDWIIVNPNVLKSRGVEVGPRYLTTTLVTDATYTALVTDKIISLDRAGNQTLTIDNTLPEGSTWEILGNVSGTKTITISAGTLFWFNGSGTVGAGDRTLAIAGSCTVTIYPGSNAIIRGVGLT